MEKTKSKAAKDLTSGSPFRLILGFAVPLLFGMLFQQFYNMVDTIIVGRALGSGALASVGSTGSINFMIIGFCMGVCNGFAIPVSQMFGAKDSSITVSDLEPAAKGLAYTGADEPSAVGCAFFAPDMIDGELKYTCVFVRRIIFGLPAMVYKTKGDSLTFQTPTTTGEFMADHSSTQNLVDVVTVDTVENAKKWVDGALGGSQA